MPRSFGKFFRRRRRPRNKRGYKDLDFEKRSRINRRVRLRLTALFLVLCLLEAGLYLSAPETKRSELLPVTIIRPLWTATLLAAIWWRQRWARYALLALLLLSAGLNLFAPHHVFPLVSAPAAVAAVMAAASLGIIVLLFTEDFRDYLSHRE